MSAKESENRLPRKLLGAWCYKTTGSHLCGGQRKNTCKTYLDLLNNLKFDESDFTSIHFLILSKLKVILPWYVLSIPCFLFANYIDMSCQNILSDIFIEPWNETSLTPCNNRLLLLPHPSLGFVLWPQQQNYSLYWSDALVKQLLAWLTRLAVFAQWAHSVDARALMRMQALEIEVTCV